MDFRLPRLGLETEVIQCVDLLDYWVAMEEKRLSHSDTIPVGNCTDTIRVLQEYHDLYRIHTQGDR